ncbi:BTAD domain-containing putative transcriptional regulator [Streptomyces sp. NPDC052012]|uniref:AfsR/SARP family transcriptional regulator n=1 Tax=Streptomyces sp. NPDC052012 TaxID=3155051 RepID=UPI00344D1E0B
MRPEPVRERWAGRQWCGVIRRELRFGLLGTPVLYVTDGTGAAARDIGSPKVRTLLAVLLLGAGRVVSLEALKEAMWGGAPPPSAQPSLHNHVARLRRLLDEPDRLVTVPSGYLLRVGEGELDVHVFDSHVAAARAAHAAGDWQHVVRACTAALALWRGDPLAGLPPEVGGYAFARRLREARLLLLEWRYDAELGLGGERLASLVPELAALTAEYPLREAYHRQLMLALHRTGRQAEALAVHRDLRDRLIEELGVEPGAGVREAHVEVLRGVAADAGRVEAGESSAGAVNSGGSGGSGGSEGPVDSGGSALPAAAVLPVAGQSRGSGEDGTSVTRSASAGSADSAAESAASASPSPLPSPPAQLPPPPPQLPPTPAQLPAPPAHFTGRHSTLRALLRTLTPEAPHPTTPAVAVLTGMPGVGKSALALQVAHQVAERFSDGQLYVNLHGATPGMTPLAPAQALAALLRDLGTEPRDIPEHPDAAAALLRSRLAPTRTLLVLDDAAGAAQIRPLLPAGPGCAVIVTSRSPLTALDGAARFPLAPLSDEDSAALLRAVSGRADLEPGHPLVALTGRLPLALRVVAARLAARQALTPDALAGQLTACASRLPHLEYDDLSVRRSLAVAHDALAASDRQADRDAALALRHIGALDLPGYGAPLLARLTGTDAHRAEAALDRLVDVALLEETAYGRYVPHDLVRDFARELAAADAAARRATDADSTPDGPPITPPVSPADGDTIPDTAPGAPDAAATSDPLTTPHPIETALRWYAAVAERSLTAIVEPGLDQDDRRRPTPSQPPGHAAQVGTVPPFADAAAAFAWGDRELENIVTLVEQAERYADDTAAHGVRATLATLLRLLYPYLLRSGRVAELEVLGRAALRVARRLGDEAAEAYALGDLAGVHFLAGRLGDALELTDRALAVWRRLDAASRIRRCLNNRGLLLEGLGRYTESGEALRQSLAYSRQLNDPYGEAVTHSHLGNLYEHTDPRAAIEQHRLSLAIGDGIGAVIVQHSAHCNIGYAHLSLGEPAAALPHFEESLRILGAHGDWHGESQTRLGLVRALRLLGHTERAAHECEELLARADARADRYTGGLARHQYGLLLRQRGRLSQADEHWRSALAALDGTDEQAVVEELRELLLNTVPPAAPAVSTPPRR